MDCLDSDGVKCLIDEVCVLLGVTTVESEITTDMWRKLVKIATSDYMLYLQEWLIKNQWENVVYKNATTTDICLNLSTRTLDAEIKVANAYAKQIGLGSSGDFILKKDYIDVVEGQQTYVIPAGREVNEVLWLTPSEIDIAVAMSSSFNWGGGMFSYSGSYSSTNVGDVGAYYIAPAYDVMLRAMDYGLKNKIRQSDLVYRITAGENGTKLLHLESSPLLGARYGLRHKLYNKKVWYYYYDTPTKSAQNKCIANCPDIIRIPSQVPIETTDYCSLNSISKTYVRSFLMHRAATTLAHIRGKYSGKVAIPDAEIQLDYGMLVATADKELESVKTRIENWLGEMSPQKTAEKKAEEAENLNRVLKGIPLGIKLF